MISSFQEQFSNAGDVETCSLAQAKHMEAKDLFDKDWRKYQVKFCVMDLDGIIDVSTLTKLIWKICERCDVVYRRNV